MKQLKRLWHAWLLSWCGRNPDLTFNKEALGIKEKP